MIWRDVYIEADVEASTLASALASAFGVNETRIGVVAGGGVWPDWVKSCEVWAGLWPTRGEARLIAMLFVNRDKAEVECLDDRAVSQALANNLNCTVFLADEADTYSDNYWRLRPASPAERVALDPDGESEDPPRVTVIGPATRPLPELEDVSETATSPVRSRSV